MQSFVAYHFCCRYFLWKLLIFQNVFQRTSPVSSIREDTISTPTKAEDDVVILHSAILNITFTYCIRLVR